MKRTIWMLLTLLALGPTVLRAAEEAKKDTYPLTTCVVSGEKLGEMGEPYIMQHEGREVRFCCKNCRKDFLKEPAKYLKLLDEAATAKDGAGSTAKTDDKNPSHEHHQK